MKTIREPARDVPVMAEADVVVLGGGPGGLPAAAAAARQGARVVLVERYGFLGGLATASLVSPLLGHNAWKSRTPIVEGLLKELTERMHVLGGAPAWAEALKHTGIAFDPEAFKRAADAMVHDAGVDLLLHTFATDAIVESGRISAVLVESKSGRGAITGRVFVDATGDADIAARAGAPFTKGRRFDGQPMAMGTCYHLLGVPDLTPEQRDAAAGVVRDALLKGTLRFYHPGFLHSGIHHPGLATPNMTREPGDSTNVRDLTRAELGVREQIWKLVELVRREVPALAGMHPSQTAPQVGPRESRQVTGDYVLTGADVHAGRKFPDAVARGSWWVDIHCPLGHTHPVHLCVKECPRQSACPYWVAAHEGEMLARTDLYVPDGDWYDIPYRCLTARGPTNLLVSGRCISADPQGMAAARVMGTCMAIGEAAGVAAAMAARGAGNVRQVDVPALRAALRAAGAIV